MENGEVMHLDKKDIDESGFSEKKLDQDTEMQAGQWLDLSNKQKTKNRKQSSDKAQDKLGKRANQKPAQPSDKTAGGTKQKKLHVETTQQNLSAQPATTTDLQRYSQELSDLIQQFIALPSHTSKEAERLTQSIFTVQGRIKTLLQALRRTS